ncbi:MAG: hypothetical protein KDA45_14775 [Planctomycetales bacterium]|nr:hypothetical protein [Planctomycetales bacterium]
MPSSVADYPAALAPAASGYPLEPLSYHAGSENTAIPWPAVGAGCDGCGESLCCCPSLGYLLDWRRADLWLGLASFNGASGFLNSGSGAEGQVEGNFGFQQGINFGTCLPSLLGGQLGTQLGMRFTQTQLDGTAASDDRRTQAYVTAGLFRRVDYGLQGGVVVDFLRDDWVYRANLLQLRGELSFLFSPCHDLGFRFTDSQRSEQTSATIRGLTSPLPLQLSALNSYRFFYRYRFGPGGAGQTEMLAGFTEDSAALLGIGLKTPLQKELGLDVAATYLMPPDGQTQPYMQEGWNLSMALVWTPGRSFGLRRDYYRPLLDVADNGSFLTRQMP